MVIQWDEPEEQNGVVTGYKVYYTTRPQMSLSQWESQFVDNNKLTTISDLTPHTIYTIRVEAYTSIGPGPLSSPVQVKTQQGVPSQPSSLLAVEVGSTNIKLRWEQPDHSGENIISYELYWNDTYTPSVPSLASIVFIITPTLCLFRSSLTTRPSMTRTPRSTSWRTFTPTLSTTSGWRPSPGGARVPPPPGCL